MDFSKYLTANQILAHAQPANLEDLIQQLLQHLLQSPAVKEPPVVDPGVLREALANGTRHRPTLLSRGVLYPHARIPGMHGVAMAVATSPVPFALGPEYPGVRLVLMVAVPEEMPALALHFLAKIARFSHEEENFEALLRLENPEAACAFLQEHLLVNDGILTAADIMRDPLVRIYPDTPLRMVTHMMLKHNLDAAGVVDREDKLLGEITCDQLFMIGVPDFFRQLKSVSFISEFDPFERYFDQESQQLAGDVMTQKYAALPHTASLLEVIFELAVRRYSKVHVIRDGTRVGVIDRILVLDKILNL